MLVGNVSNVITLNLYFDLKVKQFKMGPSKNPFPLTHSGMNKLCDLSLQNSEKLQHFIPLFTMYWSTLVGLNMTFIKLSTF